VGDWADGTCTLTKHGRTVVSRAWAKLGLEPSAFRPQAYELDLEPDVCDLAAVSVEQPADRTAADLGLAPIKLPAAPAVIDLDEQPDGEAGVDLERDTQDLSGTVDGDDGDAVDPADA